MKIDAICTLAALMPPAEFAESIRAKCSSVMNLKINEACMLHRILAPDGPLFRSVITGDAEHNGNLAKIWIYSEGIEVVIDCRESMATPAKDLMIIDDHIRNYYGTPVISYNIFIDNLHHYRTWLPYQYNSYLAGHEQYSWMNLDDCRDCDKSYHTIYCAATATRLPKEKFLNTL